MCSYLAFLFYSTFSFYTHSICTIFTIPPDECLVHSARNYLVVVLILDFSFIKMFCLIITEIVDHLYDTYNHLLTQINLDLATLQSFSKSICDKGAPLQTCFGFIDGTVRPIARPIDGQRLFYKGHKRVHAINFQCVTYPNGLIGHLNLAP